jgi:insertion element IS1 protein InsB
MLVLTHIEGAECDEMWSFVGSKAQQRWLWYAIDHKTGKILAYVLGDRKDTAFLKLKKWLFGNCRGIGCKNLLLVPLSR